MEQICVLLLCWDARIRADGPIGNIHAIENEITQIEIHSLRTQIFIYQHFNSITVRIRIEKVIESTFMR